MTDRELMQQALDALEWHIKGRPYVPLRTQKAFTALRERLAQPDGKQLNAYKLLVKSLEEQLSYYRSQAEKYREAIATLQSERQANAILTEEVERLAQPDQKPMARAWDEGYRQGVEDERISEANIGIAGFGAKVKPARQNPYGITPPQRTWVDLTDEEIMEPWPFENRVAFARWLGAKLKEKNA